MGLGVRRPDPRPGHSLSLALSEVSPEVSRSLEVWWPGHSGHQNRDRYKRALRMRHRLGPPQVPE